MGIGEALTRKLVSQEVQVVLSSRDLQRVEAARNRVGAPERTLAVRCDVTQPDQIRALRQKIQELRAANRTFYQG